MANDYTPQQIEEILQMFFDVAGTRQYIGARYVPIFGRGRGTSVDWDQSGAYEPLSIVYYQGDTYTSRRYVPAGISIDNQDYWVITGRYNAQVEQYRQEVLSFQGQIDGIRSDMESDYVPFPDSDHYPKYGTLGQVLTTLSNGETKWENPVVPSDAQAEEVITAWLNEHPEATTTVQNGAITDVKLAAYPNSTLLRSIDAANVTDLDDCMTPGVYFFGYNQNLANVPNTNRDRRLLFVYGTGNFRYQLYKNFHGANNATYVRTYDANTNTWGAWFFEMALNIQNGLVTDAKLAAYPNSTVLHSIDATSITDLNDCMTPGVYFFGYDQNLANVPNTNKNRRVLMVYGTSNFRYQLYKNFYDTDNVTYVRTYNPSTTSWTTWFPDGMLDRSVTEPKLDFTLASIIGNDAVKCSDVIMGDIYVGKSINLSTQELIDSSSYSTIDYMNVYDYANFIVYSSNIIRTYIVAYNYDGNIVSQYGWETGRRVVSVSPNIYKIRIITRTNGNDALIPTEAVIQANVAITGYGSISDHRNDLAFSAMVPSASRYVFAKGKMWVYNWNTMPAFLAALQDDRCFAISADARLTSDGKIVCYHDHTLNAQTDSTGSVISKTWAEIQQVNVLTGVWNGSSWVSQSDGHNGKIPLLYDVIDAAKYYGKPLIIEVKADDSANIGSFSNAVTDEIVAYIKSKGMENSVYFMCSPTQRNYMVSNYPYFLQFLMYDNGLTVAKVKDQLNPNYIFGAYNTSLSSDVIGAIREQNMLISGYNTRGSAQSEDDALVEKGIDLILLFREPPVSDYPDYSN